MDLNNIVMIYSNYATPSATRADMRRVLDIIYHTKSPLQVESGEVMLSLCKFLIEGPPNHHPSNLTCPRTNFVQLRIS